MATVKLVEEAKNLYKLEIDVVATTPFTVVVITPSFAVTLLELTKSTTLETIPFIKVKKELVEVEILLELIIEVEPIEPAKLEVSVLDAEVNKLLTAKLEIVALVILAVLETKLLKTGLLKTVNEVTPLTVEVSLPEEVE